MKRQIILPPFPGFIYLFMYVLGRGVRCLFAFLSLHIRITFFSLLHNTIQGLAVGK